VRSPAAAVTNAMGPSEGNNSKVIGSYTGKYNGPTYTFPTFLIDGPI